MLIAKRYQARRYLPVTCGCIGVPVSKRYRARRHLPVDCRYWREGTGTVPSRYWQTVYGMYDTSPVGAGTGTILACLLGNHLLTCYPTPSLNHPQTTYANHPISPN